MSLEQLKQDAEDAFREAGIDLDAETEDRKPPAARMSFIAGPHGHRAQVLVNGVDMSRYLSGFTVTNLVHDVTTVTLTFPAVVVDGYIEATVLASMERKYVVDDRPWWKRLLRRL